MPVLLFFASILATSAAIFAPIFVLLKRSSARKYVQFTYRFGWIFWPFLVFVAHQLTDAHLDYINHHWGRKFQTVCSVSVTLIYFICASPYLILPAQGHLNKKLLIHSLMAFICSFIFFSNLSLDSYTRSEGIGVLDAVMYTPPLLGAIIFMNSATFSRICILKKRQSAGAKNELLNDPSSFS